MVVDGASAVFTAFEAAGALTQIVKKTYNISKAVKHATEDSAQLSRQLKEAHKTLNLLEHIAVERRDSPADQFSATQDILSAIYQASTKAEACLRLLDEVPSLDQRSLSVFDRVRFVFRQKKQAKVLLDELAIYYRAIQDLYVLLTATLQQKKQTNLQALQASLTILVQAAQQPELTQPPTVSHGSSDTPLARCVRNRLLGPPWSYKLSHGLLGFAVLKLQTWNDVAPRMNTLLSLSCTLPIILSFSRFWELWKAKVTAIHLRIDRECGRLSFHYAHVVADDHIMWEALQNDNVRQIHVLVRSGQASVANVNSKGLNGLAIVCKGGCMKLLKDFIDNARAYGLDINAPIGPARRTPLQYTMRHGHLDATRLLLQCGASQDNVDTHGWNAMIFAWPLLHIGQVSRIPQLRLLVEYGWQDYGHEDKNNWTSLDRASAFGPAEDVRWLIDQGADPFHKVGPASWDARFYAAAYGNLTAFDALLADFSDTISCVDSRGFSLAHVAASFGQREIIERLVELGYDTSLTCRAGCANIPQTQLHNKAYTAAEIWTVLRGVESLPAALRAAA